MVLLYTVVQINCKILKGEKNCSYKLFLGKILHVYNIIWEETRKKTTFFLEEKFLHNEKCYLYGLLYPTFFKYLHKWKILEVIKNRACIGWTSEHLVQAAHVMGPKRPKSRRLSLIFYLLAATSCFRTPLCFKFEIVFYRL